MLDDPELTDEVDTRLKQGESAEAAWMAVIEAAARQQESLQDALLAERAADLRDIGRRVLAQLCGSKRRASRATVHSGDGRSRPVGRRAPRPGRVAGILTARGGATAHSAIVARALGIPALVGAGAQCCCWRRHAAAARRPARSPARRCRCRDPATRHRRTRHP
jgi:phosphocarrier protein FPr